MFSSARNNKTLQNIHNVFEFTTDTVHRGKWISKSMRAKKPNNKSSNDVEKHIFVLVSQNVAPNSSTSETSKTPIQPIEQPPPPRRNKEKGKPRRSKPLKAKHAQFRPTMDVEN